MAKLINCEQWQHYRVVVALLSSVSILTHESCTVNALDNGVARLPPMGWNSWVRFACNVRCDIDLENCISERLYKQMADILVMGGYRDAGYEYVMIDDCWSMIDRDPINHRLIPDQTRFPNGIAHLADYMHSRGLKLGIYASLGTMTCANYPGSWNYLQLDAQTFAEWGVDMVKLDGCYVADASLYDYGYRAMGRYLNETGRPIVYMCEWPMYALYARATINYTVMSSTCNVLRALADIDNTFYTINSFIDYFSSNPFNFSSFSGPGSWNDPDQLVIGQSTLSEDEERVQMAMWSLWSSPLIMSNDLRQISRRSKAILLNRNVIAINQDPLGIQGTLIFEDGDTAAWSKPITPPGSWAVAILNRSSTGWPRVMSFTMTDLGLVRGRDVEYHVTDVFSGQYMGRFDSTALLTFKVNPSGVRLFRATPA